MSDGFAALDRIIARIEGIPAKVVERAPQAFAKIIERDLRTTINAGQAPDGTPWPESKLTGERVLTNATDAFTVTVIGLKVRAKIKGIEARHNYGTVKGGIRRKMIPLKREGLPAATRLKLQAKAQEIMKAAADGK